MPPSQRRQLRRYFAQPLHRANDAVARAWDRHNSELHLGAGNRIVNKQLIVQE